jgi:hypothetical protein
MPLCGILRLRFARVAAFTSLRMTIACGRENRGWDTALNRSPIGESFDPMSRSKTHPQNHAPAAAHLLFNCIVTAKDASSIAESGLPGNQISAVGNRLTVPGNGFHPPGSRLTVPGNRISPPGRRLSVPGARLPVPGCRFHPPGRKLSEPWRKLPSYGRKLSSYGRNCTPRETISPHSQDALLVSHDSNCTLQSADD